MASLFTKIARREIPGYIVGEDDMFIAFLDIQPLTVGHTLVVPKKEIDYFFDCEEATLSAMMCFAKGVASALKDVSACRRVGLAVVGFEVPHAHMHLVPMNTMDDINFARPRLTLLPEQFASTAQQIRDLLAAHASKAS